MNNKYQRLIQGKCGGVAPLVKSVGSTLLGNPAWDDINSL